MAASTPKTLKAGDPKVFGFEIEWTDGAAKGSADEASRGRLLAFLDGSPVWYEEEEPVRGVEWSLVELLEHLSWTWPYLRFEECDPLGICLEPNSLRAKAEEIWQEVPSAERVA